MGGLTHFQRLINDKLEDADKMHVVTVTMSFSYFDMEFHQDVFSSIGFRFSSREAIQRCSILGTPLRVVS
jgi:hypothetical protein